MTGTPLHLGLALDGAGWHPAAWREPTARPRELFSLRYWTELIRSAADAGFDLVTIEDVFGLQGDGEPNSHEVRGRLDALLIASAVAPNVPGIGLVPSVTTTHTEPFHVGTATASLDYASEGWAGWRVKTSALPHEAANLGRRPAPAVDIAAFLAGEPEQLRIVEEFFAEAGDVIEVVRRLWDSWEDDAVIRDVATGRYLDRDKLHYVDFDGERFSVTGPSITPRPPQGQPPVYLLAHQRIPFELAVAQADIVGITPADDADLERIRAELAAIGGRVTRRVPQPLAVWTEAVVLIEDEPGAAAAELLRLDAQAGASLASDAVMLAGTSAEIAERLLEWHAAGVDGVRLRPARLPLDLDRLAVGVLPLLRAAGLLERPAGADSLRSRLGWNRPANRYAAEAVR
ncbi:LLM class flavin-dependent oxidoreductase [Microbacteriaceae bacterium VKM Ac-2854]|nr:LLM class flavin-dependent oxidoreductase [Microbacteriaceae bacterium VKM Ac-2854]